MPNAKKAHESLTTEAQQGFSYRTASCCFIRIFSTNTIHEFFYITMQARGYKLCQGEKAH